MLRLGVSLKLRKVLIKPSQAFETLRFILVAIAAHKCIHCSKRFSGLRWFRLSLVIKTGVFKVIEDVFVRWCILGSFYCCAVKCTRSSAFGTASSPVTQNVARLSNMHDLSARDTKRRIYMSATRLSAFMQFYLIYSKCSFVLQPTIIGDILPYSVQLFQIKLAQFKKNIHRKSGKILTDTALISRMGESWTIRHLRGSWNPNNKLFVS